MQRPPQEKLDRIPRYAYEYIEFLERQHAADIKYIAEITVDDNTSNVKVDGHSMRPDRPLPKNSGVDFYLGKSREKYRDMINVRHKRTSPDELEISSSGAGRLSVSPQSGNVIRVFLAEDS
jgi:hypothetical protein